MTEQLDELVRELMRDLHRLFEIQDDTVEHRFPGAVSPYDYNLDWILSYAGDIFREMTHLYPHYSYIGEKWEKLNYVSSRPPLCDLTEGDWQEITLAVRNPAYKAPRDEFLENLQKLRGETVMTPMPATTPIGIKIKLDRKSVMLSALDMERALVYWFESLNPLKPPMKEMDKLSETVSAYFHDEFYR